jgi:IS30 family transposase
MQKSDMWRRWKAGQSFHEIGRAFGKERSSTRERPAEIEDRAIPGHWGDLIGSSKNSHVLTLVERHLRVTALIKVPSKDTAVVAAALTRYVRQLPAPLQRSGLEMAKHKAFTVATNVKVYFCDPQSPWQHGSNVNMDGLLRQHFPKRSDLSGYTQSIWTRWPVTRD